MASKTVNNLVVISDLHCGCRMGLCPPGGVKLDDGGVYEPSSLQLKMWALWEQFWKEWVPEATKGEPFSVVCNGDAVDGVHHNSVTQVSHNLQDQIRIGFAVLEPVVDACHGRYFHLRGTEAHGGKSGMLEEQLAEMLGAVPNEHGQHARYDLWLRIGGGLVHALHHIGTTSSSAHEASAVNAELTAEYVEAARWGDSPADITIRSHRHRYIETRFATDRGIGISCVTPGWQGKTPFSWKIAGARLAPPQFGGLVVRQGDRILFVEAQVWTPERSKTEYETKDVLVRDRGGRPTGGTRRPVGKRSDLRRRKDNARVVDPVRNREPPDEQTAPRRARRRKGRHGKSV